MRAWLVIAAGVAVYAGAVVWMSGQLPPTGVPLHFDGSGTPTRFGDRAEAVGSVATAGAVLGVLSVAVVVVARRGPLRALNIPHRDYWTAPERRDRLRRMLQWDMALFMGTTLALLSAVPVGTVLATRADPVGLPAALAWLLAAYLIGVLVWTVWLVRYRYRPDRER